MLRETLLLLLSLTRCQPRVPLSKGTHVTITQAGPARVDGRQSGAVLLTCSAVGSPAPSLAWYKDSLFVSHQEQLEDAEQGSLGETVATLSLACLEEADAGQYECRAVAGRRQVSAVTQLHVLQQGLEGPGLCRKSAVRPEISVWRPTVMVEEGRSVSLPCRVTNTEDSLVTWSTRGVAIQTGGRLTVSQTGALHISEVGWGDMGQYTCTASNTAGSDVRQSFIYPLSPSL